MSLGKEEEYEQRYYAHQGNPDSIEPDGRGQVETVSG